MLTNIYIYVINISKNMEKVLRKTRGYCHKCFKVVPVDIVNINNSIHMIKRCKKHGVHKTKHVWDDPEVYNAFLSMKSVTDFISAKVIISITNKCNMNCPTCYARANELNERDFDVKNLELLKDYKFVFLSGGEPTVRKDLLEIISKLKKRHKVGMLSNGLRLLDVDYARKIKKSGLDIIFLQFDSLNERDTIVLRGQDFVSKKKKILKNLKKYRIPAYVVSTIIKNHSVGKFREFFNYVFKNPSVTGVALNQLIHTGRYKAEDFIPTSKIINRMCKATNTKKDDFISTTEFLMNLDVLLSPVTKRLYITKCVLHGLFLNSKKGLMPLSKIFDLQKLNIYLRRINNKRNRTYNMASLIFFLITNQFFWNLVVNKNFRMLLCKLIKNLKYFPNIILINPFVFISVLSFPTYENADMDIIDTCNFVSISNKQLNPMPSCLLRCKVLMDSDFKGRSS